MSGPIGVFDSGVGGLTVLAALQAELPQDEFVYLGDTARLPYGTKSAATVLRYSVQCAEVLIRRGVRALVVACNTASAHALPELSRRFPGLPVFGVIEPGAQTACASTASGSIAVIATEGTVRNGAYESAIRRRLPSAEVRMRACPLFVALAEDGLTAGPIADAIAHRYLDDLFRAAPVPDTLVLGCTHFPVLAGAIARAIPPTVRIVDSAATTARVVAHSIGPHPSDRSPRVHWLATDGAERFARVGSIFLPAPLEAAAVEIIDL